MNNTMVSKLNVEIGKSIEQLQYAVKEMEFKRKVYKNIFLGKGLDFDGYHSYSSSEDSSSIDWKASKRTNKLLAKQFIEEKDQKVVFLIDVGEHMVFGSTNKLKCEYAAEIAGAVSYLIISSGDKVGYILFSDKVKSYEPPNLGASAFQAFMEILSNPGTYGSNSRVSPALDYALSYLDSTITSLIIISDFLVLDEKFDSYLKVISKRFETIALMVKDPLDKSLPDVPGEIIVENPETGEQLLINPRIARKSYEKIAEEQEKKVVDIFSKNNVDLLILSTQENFVPALSSFLEKRLARKGGA